jgi:hypothetical protein
MAEQISTFGAERADAAERPAVWEDFIDIFYAPSAVFARRERGNFWIPMFVVTLLMGGLFLVNSGVLQPMMDAEFNRQMAIAMRDNPRLTPEMVEGFRRVGTRFSQISFFVFGPLAMFAVGCFLWLAGKLVEAKQYFTAAMVVTAYAFVPRVLEGVLGGLQGLFLDPSQLDGRFRISWGVGRFLDPDTTSPLLLAILGRLDVFTIWLTILLAIGLSVTGKIPRRRAAVAAIMVWVAGGLPLIVQALRSM